MRSTSLMRRTTGCVNSWESWRSSTERCETPTQSSMSRFLISVCCLALWWDILFSHHTRWVIVSDHFSSDPGRAASHVCLCVCLCVHVWIDYLTCDLGIWHTSSPVLVRFEGQDHRSKFRVMGGKTLKSLGLSSVMYVVCCVSVLQLSGIALCHNLL